MNKILLISFSDNYDHQNTLYSTFDTLKNNKIDVYSLGLNNPKFEYNFGEKNLFLDAPRRPGIAKGFLNTKKLNPIVDFIIKNDVGTLYFESLHSWNVFLINKIRKVKKDIRILHCIHDVRAHSSLNGIVIDMLNKYVCKHADKIILKSHFSVNQFKEKYKVREDKVSYLPIFREWKPFEKLGFTGNVLFFGRLSKYKGVGNLVDIISANKDINFYVVGSSIDRSAKKAAKEIIEYPNVHFVPKYVTGQEMDNCFAQCDVVILPYKSATQSGVVVDACRCSRPSIAFNTGGLSEQIEDGKTGFLVENNNIEAFNKVLKEWSQLPKEKKQTIAEESYKFGDCQHNPSNNVKMLLDLFIEK